MYYKNTKKCKIEIMKKKNNKLIIAAISGTAAIATAAAIGVVIAKADDIRGRKTLSNKIDEVKNYLRTNEKYLGDSTEKSELEKQLPKAQEVLNKKDKYNYKEAIDELDIVLKQAQKYANTKEEVTRLIKKFDDLKEANKNKNSEDVLNSQNESIAQLENALANKTITLKSLLEELKKGNSALSQLEQAIKDEDEANKNAAKNEYNTKVDELKTTVKPTLLTNLQNHFEALISKLQREVNSDEATAETIRNNLETLKIEVHKLQAQDTLTRALPYIYPYSGSEEIKYQYLTTVEHDELKTLVQTLNDSLEAEYNQETLEQANIGVKDKLTSFASQEEERKTALETKQNELVQASNQLKEELKDKLSKEGAIQLNSLIEDALDKEPMVNNVEVIPQTQAKLIEDAYKLVVDDLLVWYENFKSSSKAKYAEESDNTELERLVSELTTARNAEEFNKETLNSKIDEFINKLKEVEQKATQKEKEFQDQRSAALDEYNTNLTKIEEIKNHLSEENKVKVDEFVNANNELLNSSETSAEQIKAAKDKLNKNVYLLAKDELKGEVETFLASDKAKYATEEDKNDLNSKKEALENAAIADPFNTDNFGTAFYALDNKLSEVKEKAETAQEAKNSAIQEINTKIEKLTNEIKPTLSETNQTKFDEYVTTAQTVVNNNDSTTEQIQSAKQELINNANKLVAEDLVTKSKDFRETGSENKLSQEEKTELTTLEGQVTTKKEADPFNAEELKTAVENLKNKLDSLKEAIKSRTTAPDATENTNSVSSTSQPEDTTTNTSAENNSTEETQPSSKPTEEAENTEESA